ncbi:hypothetical protein ACWDTT_15935 [Streptosporangium sandarakinum]
MKINLDVTISNDDGAEISIFDAHSMIKDVLFNLPPMEANDGSLWTFHAIFLGDS